MSSRTGTILDKIVERSALDVATRRMSVTLDALQQRIGALPEAVPFSARLRENNPGLIAEFKRASPSKGVIAAGLDPVDVADDYIRGGAAAISVLTDEPFFKGSLEDMTRVADVAHQPGQGVAVLRKDFVVDEYQIAEARAFGADAVLLIVAVLKGELLRHMLRSVREYGLEALVEVHDEAELEEALAADAAVIGINNRDLKTFEVDLATSELLAPRIPADRTIVAESGIFTRSDVERLQAAGAHAILVGESLMRSEDRAQSARELLGRA